MSGLNGIMLGIGIGFLRNLKIDANIPMENVCGDYVTNGTLAAIWHENLAKPVEAKIVHITHKGRNLKVGEEFGNNIILDRAIIQGLRHCGGWCEVMMPGNRSSTYESSGLNCGPQRWGLPESN